MRTATWTATLDPHGPVARAMAGSWWLMLWLGLAVLVVVLVMLAVAVRRGPAATTDTERTGWFVGWGIVGPAVVLVVVLVATVAVMRTTQAEAPADALQVEITGYQWWWEVRYPDADVTTANELRLPVGEPVVVRLSSADVIHSFWVPRLSGKLDALPDGVTTLVLHADRPGEHRSQCAEFCGLQHARMGLVVTVEPREDVDRWLHAQGRPAAEPSGAVAQRGLDALLGANCVDCHTIRGTPAAGTGGPDLTHVASRPTLGAATVPNDAEHLADWVSDPHTIKEGVDMPAAELDEDTLHALLAYLRSLE